MVANNWYNFLVSEEHVTNLFSRTSCYYAGELVGRGAMGYAADAAVGHRGGAPTALAGLTAGCAAAMAAACGVLAALPGYDSGTCNVFFGCVTLCGASGGGLYTLLLVIGHSVHGGGGSGGDGKGSPAWPQAPRFASSHAVLMLAVVAGQLCGSDLLATSLAEARAGGAGYCFGRDCYALTLALLSGLCALSVPLAWRLRGLIVIPEGPPFR